MEQLGPGLPNFLGLKTTIKASDAKQQQINSRFWCSEDDGDASHVSSTVQEGTVPHLTARPPSMFESRQDWIRHRRDRA